MKLDFEIIKEVGTGKYPDLLHFANTQAQVFYIKNGELYGMPTDKIDHGEWEDVTMQNEVEVSPDTDMSHFEVKILPGWGAIGGYKTGNIHKMIIHEFAWEMDRYLNNGSIKHSIDNPISSFTLSLENPINENPEHPGNVAVNEENSLFSPGAKLRFLFGTGEDLAEYEMGNFYIDRSNFTLLSETATVDGRNLIGKALKDQTLDEKHEFWLKYNTETLEELLLGANLTKDQFVIGNHSDKSWFNFLPSTTVFEAISEVIKLMKYWKMEELADGTIVINQESLTPAPGRSIYVFNRNKDIFSRGIISDDGEAYGRVCVHTEDYTIAIYRDVETYSQWNLQARKTLYVAVTPGTRLKQIEDYAEEVVERLKKVGKIETFTGPFRPHLLCGDEAIIQNNKGNNSLGLITEIEHKFGKDGFYTNFTVDSGGKLGRGRLGDFIKRISGTSAGIGVKVGNTDIIGEEYIDLAPIANIYQSRDYSYVWGEYSNTRRLVDGNLEPSGAYRTSFPNTITFDFGVRVKIKDILLQCISVGNSGVHQGYEIDIWNSSFWVTVATQSGFESGVDDYYEWINKLFQNTLTEEIECSKLQISFFGTAGNHTAISSLKILGKM